MTSGRPRVQELCESRGGRPGLPVLMSLVVSVDVKQHCTIHTHRSQFVPNMSTRHPMTLSSTSSSCNAFRAQELCGQGGGPGLSFLVPLSLINRRVSVDVKLHGR